jgi:hypothetical protein
VQDSVHRVDHLLQPVIRLRRVDDVQDEVRDERLLERRGKALDELRRQAADETDGVGHQVPLAVVLEGPGRRVQRLEETVLDAHLGARQRVQQRRLADVRVPRECHGRRATAGALLAGPSPVLADLLQPAPKERDLAAGDPAVGLELGFAGPSRPDSGAQGT